MTATRNDHDRDEKQPEQQEPIQQWCRQGRWWRPYLEKSVDRLIDRINRSIESIDRSFIHLIDRLIDRSIMIDQSIDRSIVSINRSTIRSIVQLLKAILT